MTKQQFNLTFSQLTVGATIMFQNRANGCLTVTKVDEQQHGYVHFAPEYNGHHRSYAVESIPYTLINAVLWASVEQPWTLAAGKPEHDGEEMATNWKYIHQFASLDLLLAELPTVLGYPTVEITYVRPDGKIVHFDPEQLAGE